MPQPARAMADSNDLPVAAAALLAARGVVGDKRFLRPRLADLSCPFSIAGVREAAERLWAAADGGELVCIYGDYDVDGVTSAVLLAEVLGALGARVEMFVPRRLEEGYGLSRAGLERSLSGARPDLLVAVDCGTTSVEEAEWLAEQGVDLVILDHHEAGSEGMPLCVALVNPKVSGGHDYLAAVGVAFKVAHGMLKLRPDAVTRFDLKDQLDLVALGTVADIVPLEEENRLLVRHGLVRLAAGKRPGLAELKRLAGVNGRVGAQDIGFRLGPRINAAGRLDTATAACEMLLTKDHRRARELAEMLEVLNRERQLVERSITGQAMEAAAAQYAAGDKALVVHGEDWHPGVIGIIASRVMRRFHLPTVVIGFDDAGLGKGSARSIEGVSLVEALAACADMLVKGGGHAMAAGLTIEGGRIDEFARRFKEHIAATTDEAAFQPVIAPDLLVEPREVNHNLLAAWELLEPFGAGFPEPLLASVGLMPMSEPQVLRERHIRFVFDTGQAAGGVDAIWFNGATEGDLPEPPWDVAYQVQANEWQGVTRPQMVIRALRSTPQ